jgi:hypothetical protein
MLESLDKSDKLGLVPQAHLRLAVRKLRKLMALKHLADRGD